LAVAVLVDDEIAGANRPGFGDLVRGDPGQRQPQPRLHLGRAGGVEQHVVDAPLRGEGGEPTLGEHGQQGTRQAGRAQHAAQRLGVQDLAAGIDEDDVGGRGVDQGGWFGGQDPHVVGQQGQGRQHLGAGRRGVGQQQEHGHPVRIIDGNACPSGSTLG